ncbi:hypothetical protein MRX96_029128 [Rhipicephalus microplus]
MSGSPSRPTPPSRPQSISHEGITISGVRVAPVLQGTCSQDHWLVTGRPHLGGYMSPGGIVRLQRFDQPEQRQRRGRPRDPRKGPRRYGRPGQNSQLGESFSTDPRAERLQNSNLA